MTVPSSLPWHTAWDLMNLKVGLSMSCWGCHPHCSHGFSATNAVGARVLQTGPVALASLPALCFCLPCCKLACGLLLASFSLGFMLLEQSCYSFLSASLAFLQLFYFPYRISDQNTFTPALCYAFMHLHSLLCAFRGG